MVETHNWAPREGFNFIVETTKTSDLSRNITNTSGFQVNIFFPLSQEKRASKHRCQLWRVTKGDHVSVLGHSPSDSSVHLYTESQQQVHTRFAKYLAITSHSG